MSNYIFENLPTFKLSDLINKTVTIKKLVDPETKSYMIVAVEKSTGIVYVLTVYAEVASLKNSTQQKD